jgi:hypothetical protein
MPRPPGELRKLEEEERRRARVHRRLRWHQRFWVILWLLCGVCLLAVLAFLARIVRLAFG